MKKLFKAMITNLYLAEISLIVCCLSYLSDVALAVAPIMLFAAPAIFLALGLIFAIINVIAGFIQIYRSSENVYKSVMRAKLSLIPFFTVGLGACFLLLILTMPMIFAALYMGLPILIIAAYLIVLATSAHNIGYLINLAKRQIGDRGEMVAYCIEQLFPILDLLGSIHLYRRCNY